MNGALWIVVTLVAALVGLQAIALAAIVVQLMRIPLFREQIVRETSVPAPSLTPDQRAALDEVRALGFDVAWLGWLDVGPRRFPAAFLRHASSPAFAGITFQPSTLAGYPLAFYSIDAQDRLLVTTNRNDWIRWIGQIDGDVMDPYAASPAAQWEAHARRLGVAQDIATDAARERVWSAIEGLFDRMREAGAIVHTGGAWHARFGLALRSAFAWFRVRRKLRRPYQSALFSAAHQPAYFAACYAEIEYQRATRAPRLNVKAAVLVLSLAVSLVLWGVALDLQRAVALVIVLLVHEFGHALAMRAFGWKDLSMFFVPFIGAVVTGKPREAPAWQQIVVLLAGPLPGLLAGAALLVGFEDAPRVGLWHDIALIAISVNLFNLLPITPLDGGRLVEIALFSRWPRLRLAFALLGVVAFVALAVWLSNLALWLIALILAAGVVGQWRQARLFRAWKPGISPTAQVLHLFGVLRETGVQSFARQWSLVHGVVTHRLTHPARGWESAATLIALAAIWLGTAAVTAQFWPGSIRTPGDPRTRQQVAFDSVINGFREDRDDPAKLQELRERADALQPDDPRRVDLHLEEARRQPDEKRREALARVLAEGRAGKYWTVDRVVRTEMSRARKVQGTPAERAAALREAIAWSERVAPRLLAPTIDVRLRLAEAIDDGGDRSQALAMLATLRDRAEGDDDCRCELRSVMQAQVWFHISHGEYDAAIALLKDPAFAAKRDDVPSQYDVDHAWALLLSGRTDEGLEKMRAAAWSPAYKPTAFDKALGVPQGGPRLAHPLDMAYALRQAGHDKEARRLIRLRWVWECQSLPNRMKDPTHAAPWQREREHLLGETGLVVCPPTSLVESGKPEP